MKTFILNKKRSIILSLIIPLITSIILILLYGLVPDFIEPEQQFFKSSLTLIPILTFIFTIFSYWISIFLSKPKFTKKEIIIEEKRNQFWMCIIPMLIYAILLIYIHVIPTNPNLEDNYVAYGLMSFSFVLSISFAITCIECGIWSFCRSIKRGVENGRNRK